MDLDLADKLIALATDKSTTEEERRTAAMVLVREMKEDGFIAKVRRSVEKADEIMEKLKRMGVWR